MTNEKKPPLSGYAKSTDKPLNAQINVVAEFHAHKIEPKRIAYRTGIDVDLVTQLIAGKAYQRLFKRLVSLHRRNRRDQRLKQSLRLKGIAQADMQTKIEEEFAAQSHESQLT